MREFHRKGIYDEISYPVLNNQNPVKCRLSKFRYKWYLIMGFKRVPRYMWDYGVSWVSEEMTMNHYSQNSVNTGIYLKELTVDTVDISEYIDFGLFDKVCYECNYVLSPSESGSWLGISH